MGAAVNCGPSSFRRGAEMKDRPRSNFDGSGLDGFVETPVGVNGLTDRAGPLRDYCPGFLMPCDRKSVEPQAAIPTAERSSA